MTNRSPDTSATSVAASLAERANAEALARLCDAEPVLLDVRPAVEVVPEMTSETILASGAPLAWDDYYGGQRNGIIGGALFEGLASDVDEADAKIRAGEVRVRTCQELGLSGTQGVIFPRANETNLVLRDEVAEAVSKGQFHLWSVGHVDDVIELFTGSKAGRPGQDGRFPNRSVYGRVQAKLEAYDRILRGRGREGEPPLA